MSARASTVVIPDGMGPAAAAGRVLPTLNVVCGAMAVGVATLAGVVAFLFVQGTAPLATLPDAVLPAAAALCAALLATAPVVERRVRQAGPGSGMTEVAARFVSGTVVGMALREAPGLLGLVACLLGGTLAWAMGFAAASVAAIVLAWPRRADLEARLRRAAAG